MSYDRKSWSRRRPHSREPGYVAERPCRAGGWIIIHRYNIAGSLDGRGRERVRWVLTHDQTGKTKAAPNRETAYAWLREMAKAKTIANLAELFVVVES